MSFDLADLGNIVPIRYKMSVVATLCCIIAIYPSPSPLFHLLFLHLLILSERNDKRLYSTLTLTFSMILTFTSAPGPSRQTAKMYGAITEAPLLAGIISLIVAHRRACNFSGAQVWTRAVSFGMSWAALSAVVAHTTPLGRLVSFLPLSPLGEFQLKSQNTLTSSAARFGILRLLLRNLGHGGVDMLLATSGYTIALWA